MKKILFSLLLCTGAVGGALAVNPQYTKFMGLKYRDRCANFEPGQFQSVTGCFDGRTRDTITLFPLDGYRESDGTFYYDKWILISKNGTVPSMAIDSYYPELIYEGDLDGNGRDELSVHYSGMMGCWDSVGAFTIEKGKWQAFASATFYACNDDDPEGVFRSGGRKGLVKVREHFFNDDGIGVKTTTKKITRFLNSR